ncbi:MAG: hypothetical protein KJO12_00785 [Ignavibacteria bacterium]|nr:hypothetical protein [Ignavibacteria bacterium]
MNNKNDLVELVNEYCEQVIRFINGHNLKVKDNKIVMLFSDGEVDESTIEQQIC